MVEVHKCHRCMNFMKTEKISDGYKLVCEYCEKQKDEEDLYSH